MSLSICWSSYTATYFGQYQSDIIVLMLEFFYFAGPLIDITKHHGRP